MSASDAGAGIDPSSLKATIDGRPVHAHYSDGRIVVHASPGVHKLLVQASDYQEAKNNENVAPITPNPATAATSVRVR